MSWLSRVRNGIPFLPKRQSAENRWHKCAKCGTMVFVKEWEENYSVCPRCNFHDRIGPQKRYEQLFDAAQYELLPSPEVKEDPLKFKDTKRYSERLKAARIATHERDALVNAKGRIDGWTVIIGVCIPLVQLAAYLFLKEIPYRAQIWEAGLGFLTGIAGAYCGAFARKAVEELFFPNHASRS